jgi:hypothetical protein
LGLFWGLWAIWWWVEAPAHIPGLGEFAAFAWLSSLLLALAYWLNLRLAPPQPSRLGIGVTAGGFILLFVLNAVRAAPLAIFVLPPCWSYSSPEPQPPPESARQPAGRFTRQPAARQLLALSAAPL